MDDPLKHNTTVAMFACLGLQGSRKWIDHQRCSETLGGLGSGALGNSGTPACLPACLPQERFWVALKASLGSVCVALDMGGRPNTKEGYG